MTSATVLRLSDVGSATVAAVLHEFDLRLRLLDEAAQIPGSYWGDCEAGLIGGDLLARPDTPIHSILHEPCHYICATSARRAVLLRDAGGDDTEECAVCYLQILLANRLPGVGCERVMQDMDAWGYSFRLGSTAAWFHGDAAEARSWLESNRLIDAAGAMTGRLRC